MQWKTVFGVIPVPVIYTDDLPADVAGRVVCSRLFPYIEILSDLKNDQGLLEHELHHCEQNYGVAALVAILNVMPAAFLHAYVGVPWEYSVSVAAIISISLLAHSLLMAHSRDYREVAEVSAYRVQMQFPDAGGHFMTAEEAAVRLLNPRYRLDIDFSQALAKMTL